MCVDTDVHPHIPEGSLCQQGSERGTPRFPYLTNPSQQGGNWAAYILANANPKIWSCLVHWAQQRCSLKERQTLRELHNPPRQMQKKKNLEIPQCVPAAYNGRLAVEEELLVWSQDSSHCSQPVCPQRWASQDNASSMLTDNPAPNTNCIPLTDHATEAGRRTWKPQEGSRLPALLGSTAGKFLLLLAKAPNGVSWNDGCKQLLQPQAVPDTPTSTKLLWVLHNCLYSGG